MGNCKTKFVLTPIFTSYQNKNIEKFENEVMKDDVWKITPTDYYETKKINNTYKSTLVYTFPRKYSQNIIFDNRPQTPEKIEEEKQAIINKETTEFKEEKFEDEEIIKNVTEIKEEIPTIDPKKSDLETVHKIYTNNLGVIYVKKPKYRETTIDPNFLTATRNSGMILTYLQTNN